MWSIAATTVAMASSRPKPYNKPKFPRHNDRRGNFLRRGIAYPLQPVYTIETPQKRCFDYTGLVDKEAQHLYRKLGYKDCGCLVLGIPGLAQPMGMFLIKQL